MIVDCLLSVGSRLILRIMERYGAVGTNNSSVLCTIFSFGNILFLISGTGTLLFLCLERYIATMWSKNYETRGGWLSLCSIVVKVIINTQIKEILCFSTPSQLF